MNTYNLEDAGPKTPYQQLGTRFDTDARALWLHLKPVPRPCFTPELLGDLRQYQANLVRNNGRIFTKNGCEVVSYQVLASANPDVFNNGGDLNLFAECIRESDREGLTKYAEACINVIYQNIIGYELPITTISLVQGSALGGGFEAALSSNVLIAERRSQFGFPEILFNLFPGMGAYSLLARRINPADAEKMILSGRIYSAEELHDMGVVDVLAEDGEGEDAVYKYIRKQDRYYNGYQAVLNRVRRRVNPMSYEELQDIAHIWVDTSLQLSPKDLRVMERLVNAQNRLESSATDREPARNIA